MDDGVASAALMEAAGDAVIKLIFAKAGAGGFGERPALVFCGVGNNGGDGFVVARRLKAAGAPVHVVLVGEKSALSGAAAMMADLYDGPISPAGALPDGQALLDGAPFFVDAMFGTGVSRPLDGVAKSICEAINNRPQPTIAVDMPSGVDADTGAVMGVAVQAAATVTFITRKPGHVLYPGRALCGQIHTADIGVTDQHLRGLRPVTAENHPMIWGAHFKRPRFDTHKYSRGGVLVVSGPALRTGAARLSARASLRAGAGVVTLTCAADAASEIANHETSVMVRVGDSADAVTEALTDHRFRACVIGPAAGIGPAAAATREKTLAALDSDASCVLDADGLTAFEDNPGALFSHIRSDDVLTPHAGEFSRLFKELGENSQAPGDPDKAPEKSSDRQNFDGAPRRATRRWCRRFKGCGHGHRRAGGARGDQHQRAGRSCDGGVR